MILVSQCLLGDACKYNGGHNYNEKVIAYCKGKDYLKICPEVLGGLSIPRLPSEIVGGSAKDVLDGKAKVMNQKGEDVTDQFILGAKKVVRCIENKKGAFSKEDFAIEAILKANSPSCGKGKIYDGTFSGRLVSGNGITTELLMQLGITVKTEQEL